MKKSLLLFIAFILTAGYTMAQCGNGANCNDHPNNSYTHVRTAPKKAALPDFEVNVYPNPSTEYITVKASRVFSQILVFNTSGQLMKQFQYSKGANYYLTDLQDGHYFIRFMDHREAVLKSNLLIKANSRGTL